MRDERLIQFATETPWAILPSALMQVRALLTRHSAGVTLTPDEIRAAIGPPRQAVQPSQGAVAVIPIRGVIAPHADLMTEVSGGTSLDTFQNTLAAAVADPEVGTIVLDIDSPGGSVFGVREAAAAIRAARDRKPVIAVANHMAASAAYWLMAQATEAVASPSAMVGSVGAIAYHEDISRALDAQGVTVTVVSYGEHKADEVPEEPLSKEAQQTIQARVDHYGNEFVDDIALGRGIPRSKVEQTFGQGQLLNVPDALRVGMIDSVATVEQVIARALGGRQGRARGIRAELPDVQPDAPLMLAASELGLQSPELIDVRHVAQRLGIDASVTYTSGTGFALDVDEIRRAAVAPAEDVAASPGGATGQPTTPKEGRTMNNREELVARVQEIEARITELDTEIGARLPNDVEQHELDELRAEREQHNLAIKSLDDRRALIGSFAGQAGTVVAGDGATTVVDRPAPRTDEPINWGGSTNTQTRRRLPENLFDAAAYRQHARDMDDLTGLYAQGARHLNEQIPYDSPDDAKTRQLVAKLIGKDKTGAFALRVVETSSPMYDRAFGKMVMGHPLSSQERSLVDATISHTGLGAETPVPITLDPTILLTSDGASNPLRAMARNVTITGPTWQGLSTDGVEMVYEAELTEVPESTPDYVAPKATVAKAHAYVQFSIEVDQDWPALRENLRVAFQDAKDEKESEKFLFGDGDDEPEGIVWALDDDGTALVDTITSGALDIADLSTLITSLPPRFRSNAQWLGSPTVYWALADMTDDRTNFWLPIGSGFANRPTGNTGYSLRGYAANYADGMETDLTTPGGEVLIVGDFSKGFIIVDRVGLNVELIPHVLGSSRRPIGARALYAYFRNTSKLLTPKAFKMLKIKA